MEKMLTTNLMKNHYPQSHSKKSTSIALAAPAERLETAGISLRLTFVSIFICALFSAFQSLAQPTTQAFGITISPVTNQTDRVRIDWQRGNGAEVVVVITNATGSYTPPNGANPPGANTTFPTDGGGTDRDPDGGGEIAGLVFSGSGTTVTVTNLSPNIEYRIRLFERNGSGGGTLYNFNFSTSNPVAIRYFTGASTSWTKPNTSTTLIGGTVAQLWGGGGGGGGNADTEDGAGGGGGGAYSRKLVNTTAAGPFTVTVGQSVAGGTTGGTDGTDGEDTHFVDAATALAKGGAKGIRQLSDLPGAGGLGGQASAGVGTDKFNGGRGGIGNDDSEGNGGPGGSSAGSGSDGAGVVGVDADFTTWSTNNAAAGPIGGGQGGNGGTGPGQAGQFPGGGGGGGGDAGTASGGTGAAGLAILSWSLPSAFTVGSVTTVGGTVVAGFWNTTNTSINVQVPIANNPELTGGSVQLLMDDAAVDLSDPVLGSARTILVGELGTTISMSINAATLTAHSEFANGNTLRFGAIITNNKGNSLLGTQSATTLVVDTSIPTGATTYTKNPLRNGDAQTVTVTYSQNLTVAPTITLTGSVSGAIATAQAMAGGPTVWTYAAGSTWPGDQTVTVTIGAGADAAGNPVSATPSNNTFVVDNTANSTASYTKNFVKNGDAQTVTVNFGENLAGTPTVTLTGSVSGAIATAQAMSGGPAIWTYAAGTTWTGNQTVTVTVGSATDLAGNTFGAPASNTFEVDNTAPTSAATYTHNFIRNTIAQTVTITADEPLGTAPTITLTGSTSGAIVTGATMAGGPTVWTYNAGTSWTALNETVTVTLPAGADRAGNPLPVSPSTNTFVVDNQAPTSAATYTANAVKNGNPQTVTITSSENLVTPPTITLTGSVSGPIVTGAVMAGGPLIWTYNAGTVWAGNQTVTVTLPTGADAAGNLVVTPTTNTFVVDNMGPSSAATYSFNPIGNGVNQIVTITFGEAVTGTPSIDLTGSISGPIVTGISMAGGPTVWTYNAGSFWPNTEVITVNVGTATDALGNVVIANPTGNTFMTDNTPPQVSSIVVEASTPLLPFSITNGTFSSTLTWTVTFNEPVTGVDLGDFFTSSASVGTTIFSVTGSGTTYVVTANVLSGTGIIRLDYTAGGIVLDLAGNDGVVSFNSGGSGATYTVTIPEPTVHVTDLTIVPYAVDPMFGATVSWTPAAPSPTHYLVRFRGQLDDDTPAAFPPVLDGQTLPFDQNFFGDGQGSWTFTAPFAGTSFDAGPVNGWISGKTYFVEVLPYNLPSNVSADNINYLFASAPTASMQLPTASTGQLLAGTSIPPATISSLQTTFGPDINFSFRIRDDGTSPNSDNARTRFTSLTFTAGPSNGVGSWTSAIAQAELTDITENAGTPIFTTNITATNQIIFTGIPIGSNGIGTVDDNETKEYTLRIRLKNPVTGGWNTVIDNLIFDFQLTEANIGYFTTTSQPSRLIPGQSVTSGAGVNRVDVIATQFTFSPAFNATQPPATASVLSNLVPNPVVRAVDANGNTDRNYALPLTISNSGGLGMSVSTLNVASASPTAGVYQFSVGPANPTIFQYTSGSVVPNNGTLTVTNGALSGTSSNVTVTVSNTTTINAGTAGAIAALTEPLTFSSLRNNAFAYDNDLNGVFDFQILEDNGAGGDGAPTRMNQITITQGAGNQVTDWTEAVQDVRLLNTTTLGFVNGTVGANSFTFNFTGNNPGEFGYVADNASQTYRVLVRLRSTMLGSLPSTIDGLHMEYEVLQANIGLAGVTSLIAPAQIESSGTGNNAIDVLTTQLRFTNPIGNPTLVSRNISLQQAVPVVQATDAFGNRDLDYSSTTVALTDQAPTPRTLANVPGASSLNSGLLTFPGNFQITSVGGPATLTVATTTPNAIGGAVSSAVAGAFSVQSAISTTITAGTASPATISSVNNTAPGVSVFNFNVNDDAGGPDDGVPTRITRVIITASGTNTIPNWTQAIAGAELFDGVNSHPGAIFAANIDFDGISTATLGLVGDGATKNYILRIWLRNPLLGALPTTIDGLAFGFQVLSADITTQTVANPGTFQTGTTFMPAQSASSGAANVVTVVATQLRFNFPSTPISASLNTDLPGIIVESIDANGNRDLNFTGAASTVRAITNQTTQTIANGPVVGTTQFTSGLLTFNNNFRYTTGTNGQIVTLSLTAGTNSTCGTDFTTQGICGTSAQITLQSSFESSIIGDPNYTYAPTLDYVNHQEATNIQNTATSQEIARMLLVDGDRNGILYGAFPLFTPYGVPFGNNDAVVNGDLDGASTNLTSITIRVTNPSNIRRIALYSGTTEIATDQTVNDLAGAPPRDFTFTGSPLLTAPDNSQAPLSVRVSYWDTDTKVTDHDPIHVSVIDAVLGTGSSFFNSPPDIAGVPGGFASIAIAPNANKINVLATKLDFVSQPAAIAGVNQPVNPGAVEAHDQFGILDVDFTSVPATLFAGVPINGSFIFSLGTLDISGMQYGNTGDGTVTVTAGGLATNMNNTVGGWPNVSVQCTHVDVIHVTASYNANGVITATNLVGGTANKVVFGFTFNAPTTIPGQPKVESFRISFSNPIGGVFPTSTIKVFQSTNVPGTFGTATDVTSLGGSLSFGSNSVTVTFASPRDLSASTYSYFLQTDIDPNASGSTPQMTISLVDGGYGSATNNNILTDPAASPLAFDKPSSSANVQGQTYTFAAIFPPVLVSSYPAVAQSNVSPSQSTLELTFSVPVYSLDQKVRLTEKLPGGSSGPGVDLTLAGPIGQYLGGLGIAGQPIIFNIPGGFMQPDKEYFVTIAQGVFDGSGGTGMMDAANNLFPGITYSGTLYFRTTNNVPLKMLGTASSPPVVPAVPVDPNVSDLTASGATLNAIFDKPGKAYFLVLAGGSSAPVVNGATNEIKNPGTYPVPASVAASGSFDVNSVNPVTQFGIISPNGGTFAPGAKDVYVYAESYSELNHTLTPIPNAGAFRNLAANFAVALPGPAPVPTLTFSAPGSIAGPVTLNLPNINICNNSWQIINAPIIISEAQNGQFNAGTAAQTFNIVLPAGFQFDVSKTGTLLNYGTISLIGGDFVPGSGQLDFLGNSILTVQYKNNGIATRDKLIISGLRIRSTGSSTGPMFRLGGNALLSFIPDPSPVGTISSADAPTIDFDNSYSTNALGINHGNPDPTMRAVVTAIPDNTLPDQITLTPYINPATGDFGPSSFSGQGVNINVLTLAAVTLDVPFNITITHTDNNGCISNNPVQYTVYNHNTAVNIKKAGLPDQGPYCSTNNNFVKDQINSATPGLVIRDIPFDNLPGYRMETLTAAIPALSATGPPVSPTGPIINSAAYGGAWNFLVQSLPVFVPPLINIGGRDYRNYKFDEAMILNANAFSYSQPGPDPPAGNVPAGTLPDPYSFFRQISGQGNTYYTGGSIGFVEFTGTYRSNTNPTVVVPRKQIVEFFLPAVPLVEVGQSNQPVAGTRIYCEAGGLIAINGYPAAFAGTSQGRFTIVDDGNPSTVIYDAQATPSPITPAGFIDNGNGTASLDPAVLKNGYRRMRITYHFQQDNSPCATSAYTDLQVTPNPITDFSFVSVNTPNTPTLTAFCEDRQVDFSAASSTIAAQSPAVDPPFLIASYSWNFGEISSGSNTATGITSSHTYDLPTTYSITLNVLSDRGCPSVPVTSLPITSATVAGDMTKPIEVGGIPIVKFKLDGVSLNDVFRFNSNSTSTPIPVPTGPPAGNLAGGNTTVSSNDFIKTYDWDFGDATSHTIVTGLASDAAFNAHVVEHTYSTVGPKTINLTVTSDIGCVNSLALQNSYRSLVVLDKKTVTSASAYFEQFESSDGSWQVWNTGNAANGISSTPISWTHVTLAPVGDSREIEAETAITGAKAWKTENSQGKYNGLERSALYSPTLDISLLSRPMVSFNSRTQLENGDGVVIQYSKDNLNIADPNKVWTVLGDVGEGVDWFTNQGIAASPGDQTQNLGWSGLIPTPTGVTATPGGGPAPSWDEPKHILDEVFPGTPPTKVVFRLAIASVANSPAVEGFAMDNFRVGERTRTILLESFVNVSNVVPTSTPGFTTQESEQNKAVADFNASAIGTEVIKINYHMGFPGRDPFNEDNPADPSSRALYYNISTTPVSRLDGDDGPNKLTIPNQLFNLWAQSQYDTRTLQLSQAEIAIKATTAQITQNGKISFMVDVVPVVDLDNATILHTAVLEQSTPIGGLSALKAALVRSGENNFQYTLKKLLPSAAGTKTRTHANAAAGVLKAGVTYTFGPFEWIPDPQQMYAPATADLSIAVFLQNEMTREVYQAEIVKDLADPTPNLITGIEPIPSDQIGVYPVPANKEMVIDLPGALAHPAGLLLFDQVGKAAIQTTIPEGNRSKTLNVEDLASGVYILQIETGPGAITRKKVMVVH